MERELSQEERIRRAEEIYLRRKYNTKANRYATVNVQEKKDISLFKKMMIQMIVCLLIYGFFYLISNSNYVFSENVKEKTKSILNYDIDLNELSKNIQNFLNNFNETNNQEEQHQEETKIQQEGDNPNQEQQQEKEEILVNQEENQSQEEVTNLSQEEQDIKYIKDNFN